MARDGWVHAIGDLHFEGVFGCEGIGFEDSPEDPVVGDMEEVGSVLQGHGKSFIFVVVDDVQWHRELNVFDHVRKGCGVDVGNIVGEEGVKSAVFSREDEVAI